MNSFSLIAQVHTRCCLPYFGNHDDDNSNNYCNSHGNINKTAVFVAAQGWREGLGFRGPRGVGGGDGLVAVPTMHKKQVGEGKGVLAELGSNTLPPMPASALLGKRLFLLLIHISGCCR